MLLLMDRFLTLAIVLIVTQIYLFDLVYQMIAQKYKPMPMEIEITPVTRFL